MKRSKILDSAAMMLRAAVIYLLADVPVQMTGFLAFGSYIGIKNFLPVTLGLIFGPWGAIGSCIGCAAGGLILSTPANELLLECICNAVLAMGMWLGWHWGSTTHRIHFKRPINYLKYAGLLLGLSAIDGGIGALLVDGSAFWKVVSAYTAMGLLIGIPVNILFNGPLCVEPVLPPWYRMVDPVNAVITADPQSFGAFSEQLEEFAFERRINMKRMFEIQSCIEELYIRIRSAQPGAEIRLRMNCDDTISAWLSYAGEKYNPLRMGKDEDELDIMSLKLVKHRALRAAYSYRHGENRILIVI